MGIRRSVRDEYPLELKKIRRGISARGRYKEYLFSSLQLQLSTRSWWPEEYRYTLPQAIHFCMPLAWLCIQAASEAGANILSLFLRLSHHSAVELICMHEFCFMYFYSEPNTRWKHLSMNDIGDPRLWVSGYNLTYMSSQWFHIVTGHPASIAQAQPRRLVLPINYNRLKTVMSVVSKRIGSNRHQLLTLQVLASDPIQQGTLITRFSFHRILCYSTTSTMTYAKKLSKCNMPCNLTSSDRTTRYFTFFIR